MTRFDGKRVVVTGAASGIGKATVDRLTDDGAEVFGVDLAGGDGISAVDVTDEAAVAALMDDVGHVGGVVNAVLQGQAWQESGERQQAADREPRNKRHQPRPLIAH